MFPSILIQLENGPNDFLFLFRPPTLTCCEKICKTKNNKTMALDLNSKGSPYKFLSPLYDY